MYHVSAQSALRQKVKSTKPGNSNALERAGFFLRFGGGRLRSGPLPCFCLRLPAEDCGAAEPIVQIRGVDNNAQGRADIGPNSSASSKERQARNFPPPSRPSRFLFVR